MISVIMEGPDPEQDKFVFRLSRTQARKSNFLMNLINQEQCKEKSIRNIRLKLQCDIAVFKSLKAFFFCESGTVEELEWIHTLENQHVLDTLAAGTYLRMTSLCQLIYNYLTEESHTHSTTDFTKKFYIQDNEEPASEMLSNIEKRKLTNILSKELL